MTARGRLAGAARRLGRRLWSLQSAFYAGLVLLGASLPPIVQMVREALDEWRAERRYSVTRVHDGLESVFEGHSISVSDPYRGRDEGEIAPVVSAAVTITIDGEDHSIAAPLAIDTTLSDAGRYWNYLSLGVLTDNQSGGRRFFVAQCLPADTLRPYPMSMTWRLLFVAPDGAVSDELFTFDERGDPLYRTVIARTASPAPLGFHSQVLAVWPSLLFPFLFPFASAALGGILVAARAWVPRLKPHLRLS